MTRLILALIRLMALALSYFLSTLAAAAFVTFSLFLGGDASWLSGDPEVAVGSIGFTVAVWFDIASFLFAPFLFLMLIAELARFSGLTINLLAGGLLAVIYMVMLPPALDQPYVQQEIWLAALGAGFFGGLVHWILAGHRAGRWLGPPKRIVVKDSSGPR